MSIKKTLLFFMNFALLFMTSLTIASWRSMPTRVLSTMQSHPGKVVGIGGGTALAYNSECVIPWVSSMFFQKKSSDSCGKKKWLEGKAYADCHRTTIDFNTHAAGFAGLVGGLLRLGYYGSQPGRDFQNFRLAVLRPGIVKSALFWGGSATGYAIYSYYEKSNAEIRHLRSKIVE